MAIYKTYQEAVIANGSVNGVFTDGKWFYTDGTDLKYCNIKPCNPADYLETLKSFLASGKRLADGDLYVSALGCVRKVGFDGGQVYDMNRPDEGIDSETLILQAAADQVETPEEKEAFDAMTETAPQQFDWRNGDHCIFGAGDRSGIYVTYDAYNDGHVIYSGGEYHCVLDGNFRKPETPEQREERERLEAAYYLYCKCGIQHETVSFEKFKADDDCYPCVWLDIVDETGYRKQ